MNNEPEICSGFLATAQTAYYLNYAYATSSSALAQPLKALLQL